jgi:hypothetical protein
MKVIIEDSELQEIPILPIPTFDSMGEIVIPPSLGRPEGSANKSELEKEIISYDAALLSGALTQQEIADIHGITQQEVSFRAQAADRSNLDTRKVDEDLRSRILQKKYNIADRATARLMDSLEFFRPETLDQKDLPGAALKLASVVEKMEEKKEQGPTNNIQFMVYAPRQRSEDNYEVIDMTNE